MLLPIFAERVSGLHKEFGGSREQAIRMLAERSGLAKLGNSTYTSYLKGLKEATLTSLVTLAKGFGVSADYLCGLTEDRRPVNELLARLKEVELPPDIVQAAHDLLEVSPEDRKSLILQIQAAKVNNLRWRTLARLAGVRDVEQLRATVVEETLAQSDSVSEATLKPT